MQAARWGAAAGAIGFFLLYEDLPQLILQTQYGNWQGWCASAAPPRAPDLHGLSPPSVPAAGPALPASSASSRRRRPKSECCGAPDL